jgi:hypothetical protein
MPYEGLNTVAIFILNYVEQMAVVHCKTKQHMGGRASPAPGCHRPKGTAHPAITPFVAVEIPACETP